MPHGFTETEVARLNPFSTFIPMSVGSIKDQKQHNIPQESTVNQLLLGIFTKW